MIKVLRIENIIVFIFKVILIVVLLIFLFNNFSIGKYSADSIILNLEKSYSAEAKSEPYDVIFNSEVKLANTNLINNFTQTNDELNEEINNENINDNNSDQQLINTNSETHEEKSVVHPTENAQITEVNNWGINPRTTDEYTNVKINNSTDYNLTEDILNYNNLKINKKKILIYHTHTCESYTPTENMNYEPSGNYRTVNLDYSVARVGDELEKQLLSYDCEVIHDKTYHDYPAYNGSYSRSLVTAQNIVNNNNDIDIIIDLHRDAIADSSYAPKVKIDNEYASQLMFVIGSNVANSVHTNWAQNLKFALAVQHKANELYPGLFKPIILRNSEYNQHLSKAACIIEVGATGNTLEESINSMKYLAKVLMEF